MKANKPAWPPKPRSLTERGYRIFMAKQSTEVVNGQEFTLQSVSPTWYAGNTDRFGRGKNTIKYIDEMIRNIVVLPAEVAQKGVSYFDDKDDTSTAFALLEVMENFLARPSEPEKSKASTGTSVNPK